MSNLLYSSDTFDGDIYQQICDAIADTGYIVLPNALPEAMLNELLTNLIRLEPHNFKEAGIGRDEAFHHNQFVRTDQIQWVDSSMAFANDYLSWMEQLRVRLNRSLFLGLFDYESMFAHYPQGAFYKRHLDAFKGSSNRKLTTVLYLNPQWSDTDGGELLIYHKKQKQPFATVKPHFGTMVIFLSEQFPHEVVAATRSRFSITGWFRINEHNPLSI